MSFEIDKLQEIFLEINKEPFYALELELDSEMNFTITYYYDELKSLNVSFTVILWEYIRFNDFEDTVSFILEIENIKLEDLPF